MDYETHRQPLGIDDYLNIRRRTGLSPKSREAAAKGLPNSVFSVYITCGQEVVGMGRIVGDAGCWLQIVDIAVLPEHQGRGLGRRIMTELVEFITANALPGLYVSLLTDTPGFFEPFGFNPTSPPYEGMCRWFPPA
ncbi:MAG: GNAT family N-acetyltransferase [Gammaproteobacteria bacterium]|nr:GNAT family N-acetyltransferase [Gammaproteobacteria bacterium]